MNKNQQAIAKFIEKWGTELPSDAWMDIVKLCSDLKDNENSFKNGIASLRNKIDDMSEEISNLEDSIHDE